LSKVFREALLLIGRVIGPHGVRGLLKIESYARSEDTLLTAGRIYLKQSSGKISEYEILSAVPHKGISLIRLEGLDSSDQVEPYRGAEILIRKAAVSRDKDEYFWHELIGLRVYLETGRYLGTVKEIVPTAANDIYVVREGKEEFLIPAIHDVVKAIDLESGNMIISEVEGLLDLNEV
jgi:16S rRNA processing protein RimM